MAAISQPHSASLLLNKMTISFSDYNEIIIRPGLCSLPALASIPDKVIGGFKVIRLQSRCITCLCLLVVEPTLSGCVIVCPASLAQVHPALSGLSRAVSGLSLCTVACSAPVSREIPDTAAKPRHKAVAGKKRRSVEKWTGSEEIAGPPEAVICSFQRRLIKPAARLL